ncbi:MAG: glycosyltransferase family 2 protein [Muribaculaceae bacterium]|nr:glycosyltransferase family 2 protein [Muribaculaceae bacterium]
MISVIIPLFNKALTIKRTIETVLSQTYRDYEIVVVDDGSTDGSFEIVRDLNIPGLRLIRQVNSGVSAARNKGIEEARGEYIALLDADDEWDPGYLESQYRLACTYPQASVFASNYKFRDMYGNESRTIINRLPFVGSDGLLSNYFEVASCSHPPLWTSAVMARKDAFQSIGGFPVGIRSGEDLLTWARLAARFKIAYNTKPLAIYVIDERLFNDDQKRRRPEKYDYVGDELAKLYCENPQMVGLRKYVSLWHKMRCRIFISKYERVSAIVEGGKAIAYNVSFKNIVFLCLSFLPLRLSNKIINRLS